MTGIECAFWGRVGREPELRRVKDGTLALLTFSAAVEEERGDGDAPPEWVRVVVFGEKAEELAGRLTTGARCYIEGKLRLERWEGRDGAPRAGLTVTASVVQVMGAIGKRRPARSARPPAEASAPAHRRPTAQRAPTRPARAPVLVGGDDDGRPIDWERGDDVGF